MREVETDYSEVIARKGSGTVRGETGIEEREKLRDHSIKNGSSEGNGKRERSDVEMRVVKWKWGNRRLEWECERGKGEV